MLLSVIPALLNDLPPVENLIDQLPRHKSKKYPMRKLDDIQLFVVHHMASEAALVNQALYHINGRGWAGLGYHIVIWGNRIIQANPLDWVTNHTSGHNPQGIGVAILGDLSKRSITDTERKLVAGVLASLNAMLPGRKIVGHNECVPTQCPATSMEQVRRDVAELEFKLSVTDTPNDKLAKIVKLRARVEDIYQKAINPQDKYNAEAIRKMMQAYDMWVEKGVL